MITVHGLVSGSPVDLLPAIPPIAWWLIAAVAVLVATVFALAALLVRSRRQSEPRPRANLEDWLTRAVAGIATGVSAQGMWRFTGDVLGMDGPLRLLLFAFIELAVITSAVRARRSMRENFSAGIDGIAVWALACLTAILSSLDARSLAETLFRLCAPLVAAWLWERGMAIERHRLTGRSRINWRINVERIAVYLGLAEAKGRTTDEVDTQRRLTAIALAAQQARDLREAGASARRQRAALKRVKKAMSAAEQHVGLGNDETKQQLLKAQIAALYSTDALLDVEAASAWTSPSVADEPPDMAQEARAAIAAYDEWKRPRFVPFPITRQTQGVTSFVTSRVTPPTVTPGVTHRVTDPASEPVAFAPANGSSVTRSVTPPAIADRVTPEVTFDVTDPDVFDLERLLSGDPDVTPIVTSDVTGDRVTEDVTGEVTDEDPETRSKTEKMRAHWDAAVAKKCYPSVAELAEAADAHHSLASRKRPVWVAELPWQQRRKANARREKASA